MSPSPELKWRALRIGLRRHSRPIATPGAGRISNNSAPSAARCCRALPASRCCGTNSRSRGGNGRSNGGSRTTPNAPHLRNGRGRRRNRVRRIRAMDRRPAAAVTPAIWRDQLGMKVGLYLDVAVGVQSDGFDAWNEQAAISRHLGVGAPPDPLNTAGQSWGLAGFNAAGLEAAVVRAVSRHAARLDAPCRRDPARPCAGPEAALSGAARLYRRRWRLCADAVRGAAGGDRAGKRRASLRRDRRGSRHRAGRFSRADGRLGHLVLSGDDVRARRSRRVPRHRSLLRPTRSSPSTPTISRPMPAGARSAI